MTNYTEISALHMMVSHINISKVSFVKIELKKSLLFLNEAIKPNFSYDEKPIFYVINSDNFYFYLICVLSLLYYHSYDTLYA